jgi:hypothetical protein
MKAKTCAGCREPYVPSNGNQRRCEYCRRVTGRPPARRLPGGEIPAPSLDVSDPPPLSLPWPPLAEAQE